MKLVVTATLVDLVAAPQEDKAAAPPDEVEAHLVNLLSGGDQLFTWTRNKQSKNNNSRNNNIK